MKVLKYLLIGVFFGIVLVKAEVVSWYRIYEMFRLQSWYMYGVIGSAVVTGIIGIQIIKNFKMRNFYGEPYHIEVRPKGFNRYLYGGIIFGLGWAMVGACPGPMFALIGTGYWAVFLVIVSALIGTFAYGLLRRVLPH